LISKDNPIEPKTESDTKTAYVQQVAHPKSLNTEQLSRGARECERERERAQGEEKTKSQLGVDVL
jgi:hypothetical protein